MFRSARRLSLPAVAIAVLALAAPAASAAVDYRSPDSKAAATEAQAQGSVDLRSPDARDAGQVAQSSPVASETAESSGFDWGDAAIGAGTVLGLLLIGLSAAFAVVHRRRASMVRSERPVI